VGSATKSNSKVVILLNSADTDSPYPKCSKRVIGKQDVCKVLSAVSHGFHVNPLLGTVAGAASLTNCSINTVHFNKAMKQ